jgi:hypothetical protein
MLRPFGNIPEKLDRQRCFTEAPTLLADILMLKLAIWSHTKQN